jgi:WD40 repeat protein
MMRWFAIALGLGAAVAALWWIASDAPPEDRRIVRVAASASGRWLAAGSASGEAAVLEREGRQAVIARARIEGRVLNHLQFSPSADLLGIAARDLWIWRFGRREAPLRLRAGGRNYGMVEFDPEGATILTVTGEGRMERIDLASGRTLWEACCTSIYGEVRFSPDGRTVVNAGHRPGLWDAATGERLESFEPDRSAPAFGPVAFDTARGVVCLGSQDGSVLCRDLATRKRAEAPPRQPGWIEGIAFSRDGASAALLVRGVGVRLWERDAGAMHAVEGEPTSDLASTPDGFAFAVSGRSGENCRTFHWCRVLKGIGDRNYPTCDAFRSCF